MCSCCVHTICFVYLRVSCQPQVGACVPATMSAQKIRPCNPEWNCCLLSREFHAWAKTPLIRRRGYEFPRLKHAIMRKHASGRGHARGVVRVNLPCNLTAAFPKYFLVDGTKSLNYHLSNLSIPQNLWNDHFP